MRLGRAEKVPSSDEQRDEAPRSGQVDCRGRWEAEGANDDEA